jgi:hypothetical protein
MVATECLHIARKRHGFTRTGEQRFRYKAWGVAFTEKTEVQCGSTSTPPKCLMPAWTRTNPADVGLASDPQLALGDGFVWIVDRMVGRTP